MQWKIHLFFTHLTFCILFIVKLSGKPLVGENVRQVDEGRFKYLVGISLKFANDSRRYRQICTGALVSNRDVLTSHHCVDGKDRTLLQLHIGSRDLRNAEKKSALFWLGYEQWAEVVGIQPDFQSNDIAMIRLRENVTNVRPGLLSSIKTKDLTNLEVTIVGWGKKLNRTKPNILERVEVKVLSKSQCQTRAYQALGRNVIFEAPNFCTYATPYALVHDGDSGDPVIYRHQIVGITKGTCPYAEISDNPHQMNVHLGVYLYRDFISGFINNIPNIP